jgi:hypothetical protein
MKLAYHDSTKRFWSGMLSSRIRLIGAGASCNEEQEWPAPFGFITGMRFLLVRTRLQDVVLGEPKNRFSKFEALNEMNFTI